MPKTNSKLIKDLILISLSIVSAILLVQSGIIENLLNKSLDFGLLSIFIAGIFFTSIFTTAPAIAIITEIADREPLWAIAVLGGVGAVFGDYIIFHLIRYHIKEDVKSLLNLKRRSRWRFLFSTRIPKWFLALVGGIVIASPLPDELGIALIGFSKTNTFAFAIISFLCNSLGILVIAFLARQAV
jgi:hypothetical protein